MPATVPFLDVSAARTGDLGELPAQLDEILRTIGFVQVVGHGIDPADFHAVYDADEPLWEMSNEQLDGYLSPNGHPFRGVKYFLDEHGERTNQRLQNCRIATPEEAAALGYGPDVLDFFGGNVEPDLPELVAAIARCFAQGRALGQLLTRLMASALGLGPTGFDHFFTDDVSYFAVQDYPGLSHARPDGYRLGWHSDSGALTMLHQRGEYQGLQLRDPEGEILTVPIVDEAIIVNVGDLMARWTNDRWKATPHVVVDGPVGLGRSSIAMHYLPNVDTVIEPLPGCVPAGAASYPPVTMYDWDRRYFEKRSRVLTLADEA
jgi:isopenicillin N synthase-like dioxygenase